MDVKTHTAKLALGLGLAAALLIPGGAAAATFSNVDVTFKGAGWLKSGMVMTSTDTLTGTGFNNYNGNWLQDAGVLFTGIVNLNPEFEAAFGLGAIQRHPAQGKETNAIPNAGAYRLTLGPVWTQSRVSWFPQGKKDFSHKFDFGLFPYKYDNNIKNLGLYLIRGPVYPGLLFSGFESKEMLNTANMLGARMMNKFGPYTQDLVLTSETDIRPYYDFSFIYVGTLKLGSAFEIGGGFNLYHYLPVRPGATSPSAKEGFQNTATNTTAPAHPFDHPYAVPTAPGETTWVSHKGTKLMGRFALNTMALLGEVGFLNKTDLMLYGEVGVIGLDASAAYKQIYGPLSQRMPMMIGFNFPTFKAFDVLALEVEWYGSKLVPDYRKVMDQGSAVPQSPWINRKTPPDTGAPAPDQMPYDGDSDNLKWSLYAAKVFAKHVKISGQVANDHFRVGGTPGLPGKSYEEALTAPSDWYWFLKLSYFF